MAINVAKEVTTMKRQSVNDLRDRYQEVFGEDTGGNMDRSALKALIRDIEAGKVDCVMVHKVTMTPNHTTKAGNKRYRYNVCTAAQKRGWHTCPSKSIPAK